MKLTDLYVAQLDREAEICRRVLARVPEGKPDWKPHPKSMELEYLAYLVASMWSWLAMEVLQDSLDIAPADGPGLPRREWKTGADLVAIHDETAAQARQALTGTNDAHLMTTWKLLARGRVVDESPRHVVITDTFTHLAHHRGQLTVYLRLNDVPVPSVYGPTADERSF